MTYYLISIGFVILAAAAVVWRAHFARQGADPILAWQAVDLPSFYMLLEPSEVEFLKEQLQPPEFRRHYRRRLKTAWEYLGRISHNARLVVHTGQMMQAMSASPNFEAQQLVEQAVQVRTEVLRMQLRVALSFAVPGLRLDVLPGLQHYRDMEVNSAPLVQPVEALPRWVH